ncbi:MULTISPECIES: hypothetical protein [Psychrilyobacter]|uniref:Glycoside hydrolase family 57 N-terminal domain-containing protein n=1 Tax=Psychrilyobacter piezotolerans TaxID=2293438 RepID=A0ABX9KJ28_9FUSO|nr:MULTISPECIES: hypothetical protein [Psychrilyobacter]MCS5421732.1 hypothetical protein [Psychrilyobacter sp. S5]NDI77168.1 hypothetical protein [Psychrilyobacter piezotolerans]RDE64160.1 hypothetical protein DV867_04315 [Psychrilyobacter sp. S5]REI42252.1 hypothetical protein DYH56_04315 [Psychrilyobacter piezotolerans]
MSYIPVKYILFSHYCPGKDKEFEIFKKYVGMLKEVLSHSEQEGILVLFYDPGWIDLLNTVGADFDPNEFCKHYNKALELQKKINALLNEISLDGNSGDKTLVQRIRFITANDLYPIVNNLRGERSRLEAIKLRHFLGGEEKGMKYDTSKIVEAIIRLRHIGSNIPVFRIDWDVLFNNSNLPDGAPLQNSITSSRVNYEHCNSDPRIYSFLFSSSYTRPLKRSLNIQLANWTPDDWIGAFPTRVFPALLAKPELINCIGGIKEAGLEKVFENAFDPILIEKFYGINDNENRLRIENILEETDIENIRKITNIKNEGIKVIGSNPISSVISGALFCLSEGAILDLPPFSNFHLNVMWIDDHLKYILHRELKHLSAEPLKIPGTERYWTPIIPDSMLKKERGPVTNVGFYVLGSYIPTVLWGTIMDAWIQPDSTYNYAHIEGEIPLSDKSGSLTIALSESLKRGKLYEDEMILKGKLQKVALERIEKVRKLWNNLNIDEDKKSFAALWVGDPRDIQKKFNTSTCKEFKIEKNNEWIGWGLFNPNKKNYDKIESIEDLNPKVQEGLERLINDAIKYIHWALEWPRFAQSIRSVEPGELRMDIKWKPPKETTT